MAAGLLLSWVCLMTSGQREPWQAKWIWIRGEESPRNFHLCARKIFTFPAEGKRPRLRITADTRYIAYLNGVRLGRGPIRSWPFAYHYDEYDLTGKVKPGRNVLAVLVNHFGIGTFQVIPTRGGLIAEISWEENGQRKVIPTDHTWEVMPHPAFSRRTPRVACQQGWAEFYDARKEPVGWLLGQDKSFRWENAVEIGPCGMEPWTKLLPRPIPQLTEEPVYPVRILSARVVKPPRAAWALDLRPNLIPGDREANPRHMCGLLVTTVTVPEDTVAWFYHRGAWTGVNGRLRVNGQDTKTEAGDWERWLGGFRVRVPLRRGENLLVWDVTGTYHEWSINFGIKCPFELTPRAPLLGEGAFVTYGPFKDRNDPVFKKVWQAKTAAILPREKTKMVDPLHVYETYIYHLVAWAEDTGKKPKTSGLGNLCAANEEPAVIFPLESGDVELVLDFGRMTVGFAEFALEAGAGTILDFNGFEAIQEGKWQLTSGMENSFRYVCREGYQRHTVTNRHGFRYLIVTVRNLRKPLRIFWLRTLLNTYPVVQRGDFRCNDELLNTIWRMGRYTTRLCSEDTFVDCPTFEQTFWVGDSRNEGAVNLIAFGEYALSKHCLILAGQSLERSPVVESQVPSAWKNILTAWSLLWSLACEEYYQATGDLDFVREIYPFLAKQAKNFAGMRNEKGLLFIRAWNMLDWAPMDTPGDGIVTHQNAWLVESWRRTARLARLLGKEAEAKQYEMWAEELKHAINRYLWNEEKKAYVDCIRADGHQSPVVSQQTNVVMFLTDCATPERKKIITRYVREAPEGFVKIGSPFMMFFVFEALAKLGDFERILELTREKWGFMVDQDATTCWEVFPRPSGWWTRSHCHAWSSAPTYFLSAYQLGIRPLEPGYRVALIAPEPADLKWARGKVPTPKGVIRVDWKRTADRFWIRVELPEGIRARIVLPEEYGPERFPKLAMSGEKEKAEVVGKKERWVVTFSGRRLELEARKAR